MAATKPDLSMTIFSNPDLNLVQAWRERQDRRDEIEFAAVIEAGGQTPATEKAPTDKGGGTDSESPTPQDVLAEKPVKKSVDELLKYRQMRAAEGPEGGVYDATKLGRSGWKDEVAKDPVAALMKLVDEVTRASSPDIKGSMPGTPGDAKGVGKALKTAGEALKKMTSAGAGGEVAKTNLTRVDASQSVKDTMARLNQQFGQAKKTTTHAETIAGSQGGQPIPEGHVRLLRGEGPVTGAGAGVSGKWFTTEENAAKGFAGQGGIVKYVDVPEGVAAASRRPGDSFQERYVLPNEWAGKAKPYTSGKPALTLEEALATPDAAWDLRDTRFKVQALRDLDVNMSAEADKLHKLAINGDTTAAEAYLDTALLAAVLGNKNRMAGTGAGQLLEARKVLADAERAGQSTTDLAALVERLAGEGITSMEDIARVKAQMLAEGIDGMRLAEMMAQLPPRARKPLMRTVWDAYKVGNDAFHWLFLQSLLSSPVTHAANVLGTGVATAWHFPERYVAEWVNRVFRHDPAGVQRGETWAGMRVAGQAVTDGLILLRDTIKSGVKPFGQSTVETRFDITAQQFGWDPNTPIGKLLDTVGMFTPTRLMMGADGFFKGFNKRIELSALALREAMARNPKTAEEMGKIVGKLEAKPLPEMVEAAETAANLRTLNLELGTVGKAAMTIRNGTPGASYVMPFIQTPTNSIKWAWQRAPVLSLFSAQNIKDIAAGGAARDLAMSRILLGHAVGGAIAYQVVQGNITGSLPIGSNKALKRDLRELGPREFTIKSGDEYFGYKRTDPVGGYIATIATGIEIYSQLNPEDPHEFDYADFAAAAALAAGRVALDTPWLTGLGNVLEAIERPDADGKKIAMGLARAIVPAGIRRGTETGFLGFTEARPEIRELESLLDAVKSGLPGFAEDIPPVLHPITGETIVRPPGWGPDVISPIFVTQRADNPVLEEIITHRMSFSEPSKMVFGADQRSLSLDPTIQPDGIKLNAEQYFRLKQIATSEIMIGGRNLQEAMEAEIRKESYQRASPGPDNGKEDRLKTIYRVFYDKARIKLQDDYPSLRQQIHERREMRIRQKLPETSPNAQPAAIPGLPGILNLGPGLTLPGAR